jgi:hypothetical protein
MLTARQEIARERRRQIQVRKAFEAGLGVEAWAGRSAAAFFLACAEYLAWSMDRLHRQDQVIHDLLSERIPPQEADAHERLAVLNERQARSRTLVAEFSKAADALRESGGRALQPFEAAARQFTETFCSLLQPRKNPFFRHTDQLFTDSDWNDIADVTPQSLDEEQRLFTTVQRTAPPGVGPEQFTAEHPPG